MAASAFGALMEARQWLFPPNGLHLSTSDFVMQRAARCHAPMAGLFVGVAPCCRANPRGRFPSFVGRKVVCPLGIASYWRSSAMLVAMLDSVSPMVSGTRKVALAALWVCLGASLTMAADGPITNADIVRLTEAGVGDEAIVAMIESSDTDFNTGVDAVLELAKSDVSDAVIAAMVAVSDAVRSDWQPAAGPQAIAGTVFREPLLSGGEGPEMVVVPPGRFHMGCHSRCPGEWTPGRGDPGTAMPVHDVSMGVPFAVGV